MTSIIFFSLPPCFQVPVHWAYPNLTPMGMEPCDASLQRRWVEGDEKKGRRWENGEGESDGGREKREEVKRREVGGEKGRVGTKKVGEGDDGGRGRGTN